MPPRSTDHPRACGANYNGTYSTFDDLGSSPRMRGKLTADAGDTHSRRIIPAHAGQTDLDKFYGDVNADHPRACGANGEALHVKRRLDGSSPRMRGKLGHRHRRYGRARIIPAHAGQTPPSGLATSGTPDHPRACGANEPALAASLACAGSSPRMRGKQSDFMRKLLSAGPSIIGFAQWLQSSYYCSCLQSSAKTPISRGTTPTSLFLGFQNSITLLLLT